MLTTVIASRIFIFSHRSAEWDEGYQEKIQAQLRKTGLNVFKMGNMIIGHDAEISQDPADEKNLLIDVYPGTARYLKSVWNTMPREAEESRRLLERETQVFNLFHFNSNSFSIFSDFLAIKPLHVCETDHYIAIASKIIDLREVLNVSLSETDPLAIAELLYFGMPLENRTLHKRIQRLPAVGHTRWSQQEGFVRHDISLPDPTASISLEQAAYQAKEALVESVRKRLDRHNGTNLIALSGGIDSRLIAAQFKELGASLRACSYGQAYHTEIKAAKKVAKILGIDHFLLPYARDNYIKNILMHVEAMEGQCETHSTQMCNLLKINADKGSTFYIGFLGGALRGNRLSLFEDKHYRSLDGLAKGIFSHYSNEHLDGQITRLGLQLSKDEILHALYLSLANRHDGYFALMLWDWKNRQRRYVGSHFAILGSKFRVAAPYYDPKVINAWVSIPRIALDKSYLNREILVTYHPELAEIPFTYERFPIKPNIRAQLSLLMEELPIQILRKLRMKKMLKSAIPWRNPRIHRLSKGATSYKQRLYQIEKIRASKPQLQNELSLHLGDRVFDTYLTKNELTDSQLKVLRLLFGFSEYANWLAGKS